MTRTMSDVMRFLKVGKWLSTEVMRRTGRKIGGQWLTTASDAELRTALAEHRNQERERRILSANEMRRKLAAARAAVRAPEGNKAAEKAQERVYDEFNEHDHVIPAMHQPNTGFAYLGKICIVRCKYDGVWVGRIMEYWPQHAEVRLADARRLWKWNSLFVLSELAMYGPNKEDGCMFGCIEPDVIRCEVIGFHPCSEKAVDGLYAIAAKECK